MSLSHAEIADLEVDVMKRLAVEITSILTKANRMGTLEQLLGMLEMKDLLEAQDDFEPYEDGKILVIGDSQISEDKLRGIISDFGQDKNDFEFCLGYDKAKNYNFRNLHYNANYRAILIGPLPHSTSGKGDSSSIITEMETKPGYPLVVRITTSNELKITKTSFREALKLVL